MAFVSSASLREAVDALRRFRGAAQSQAVTHLFPFLSLRWRSVEIGRERPYEEADDFAFWDQFCRVDDDQSARCPYADPFLGELRIATHPHSNVATARKGTFARVWGAASFRDDRNATLWQLGDDYLQVIRDRVLTKGGQTTRAPIWAIAAWLLRNRDLGTAPDFAQLVAAFRSEFNVTDAEGDALFDPVPYRLTFDQQPPPADQVRALFAPCRDGGAVTAAVPAAGPPPPTGLIFDPSLRARVRAALDSGQHVLLVGPPGTGKSSLALELAAAAQVAGRCDGVRVASATGDWTSFETFGGLLPQPAGGALEFVPGLLLEAISNNRWLVLDELNRANVDRALGPLLTLMGSFTTPVEVALPLRDGPERLRISRQVGTPRSGRVGAVYQVGDDWRLIATMNTFDRLNLFPLGAALARRFATIYVGVADPDAILTGLGCPPDSPMWGAARVIMSEDLQNGASNTRPLGPAVVKDMIAFGRALSPAAPGGPEATIAAIGAFVLPQFLGLDDAEAGALLDQIAAAAAAFVGDDERATFVVAATAELSQELRRLQGL